MRPILLSQSRRGSEISHLDSKIEQQVLLVAVPGKVLLRKSLNRLSAGVEYTVSFCIMFIVFVCFLFPTVRCIRLSSVLFSGASLISIA